MDHKKSTWMNSLKKLMSWETKPKVGEYSRLKRTKENN